MKPRLYNTLMAAHGHKHIHLKKKRDILDYLVYLFMIATPLFEIPQAYDIYTAKSADHVALSTWVCFFLSSVVWVAYGIRNKLLPVIVAYSLYFVMELIIIVGILIYK